MAMRKIIILIESFDSVTDDKYLRSIIQEASK